MIFKELAARCLLILYYTLECFRKSQATMLNYSSSASEYIQRIGVAYLSRERLQKKQRLQQIASLLFLRARSSGIPKKAILEKANYTIRLQRAAQCASLGIEENERKRIAVARTV